MSSRYLRLLDLLKRPGGVDQHEACSVLGVSPSTYRGMVRDFRDLFEVQTVVTVTDKRRARHFIRTSGAPEDRAVG
jgi:hypothetical protein